MLKFLQNPDLAEELLSTGDCPIYERSYDDEFYGTGPNGDGENHAGIALMRARKFLREHSDEIQKNGKLEDLLKLHDEGVPAEKARQKEETDRRAEEAAKKKLADEKQKRIDKLFDKAFETDLKANLSVNQEISGTWDSIKGLRTDLAELKAKAVKPEEEVAMAENIAEIEAKLKELKDTVLPRLEKEKEEEFKALTEKQREKQEKFTRERLSNEDDARQAELAKKQALAKENALNKKANKQPVVTEHQAS